MRALVLAALLVVACGDGGDDSGEPASSPDAGKTPVQIPNGSLDAGAEVIHIPPGTMPSRPIGDAGPVQHNDSGFAVMEPSGPRSTARIRGLVLDQALAPLANTLIGAGASAGGAIVAVNASGYFSLDEVYGEQEAEVVVSADAHTEARVRVPIRDGEESQIVVVLTQTSVGVVPDLAAGGVVELPPLDDGTSDGKDVPSPLVVTLPASALRTPWGATGASRGRLRGAVLDQYASLAALPGEGTVGQREDGTRVRLHARAAFTWEIEQGGTRFALEKAATVALSVWPDAELEAAPAGDADRFYWFDPAQGVFVERGPVAIDAGAHASGEVDRFGWWLIARPREQGFDCVHGKVVDVDGAPVPFASVRVFDVARFDALALFTDAQGEFCADALAHGSIELVGLGRTAAHGLVRLNIAQWLSVARPPDNDVAAMCGAGPAACVELGPLEASQELTCVRGRIAGANTSGAGYWMHDELVGGLLPAGDEFCIDAPIGSKLSFVADGICNETPTVAPGVGLCGDDGCMDIGAIKCCADHDQCGDAVDGDCDDQVDEGCICGTNVCGSGNGGSCCTGDQQCGLHATLVDKCIATMQPGTFDTTCPMELGDDGLTLAACCRPDGQCGLLDGQFGCVARADAGEVWTLSATLAPQACTPL